MAGFNDVLKALGYGVGAVTGGPSQVKTVAGVVAVQGKINGYLSQFGQKIGGLVGSDVFKRIGAGAEVSANAETAAFVDKNILTDAVKTKFTWIVGLALVGVAYFFYKGK